MEYLCYDSPPNWRRISTGSSYIYDGLITDLTIRLVNGEDIKEYKVHKFVFQLASEVFQRMLNSTFEEAALGNIVEIKDVKPDTFLLFLDRLYGEPLDITDLEQALGLLHLADSYKIYRLKEDVINFCLTTLTPDVACLGLEIALKCEVPMLKESKLRYISTNTKRVVECTNFMKASLEVIDTIVEQDEISIKEIDLFQAVRAWIQRNLAEKGESIKETLIPKLRYSSMSLKEFIDGPVASELLKYNEIARLISRLFTKNRLVPLPAGFSEAKRICPHQRTFLTESLPLLELSTSFSSINLTTNKRIMLTHFFIYPVLETEEYEEDISIFWNNEAHIKCSKVVYAVDKIEIKLDNKIQLDKDVKYEFAIITSTISETTRRNAVDLKNKIINYENILFKFEVAADYGSPHFPLHSFIFEY